MTSSNNMVCDWPPLEKFQPPKANLEQVPNSRASMMHRALITNLVEVFVLSY